MLPSCCPHGDWEGLYLSMMVPGGIRSGGQGAGAIFSLGWPRLAGRKREAGRMPCRAACTVVGSCMGEQILHHPRSMAKARGLRILVKPADFLNG